MKVADKASTMHKEEGSCPKKRKICRNCDMVIEDERQSKLFHRSLCISLNTYKNNAHQSSRSASWNMYSRKMVDKKKYVCRRCNKVLKGKQARRTHRSLCAALITYRASLLSSTSTPKPSKKQTFLKHTVPQVCVKDETEKEKALKCRNCNGVINGTQSRQFHRFLCISMNAYKDNESPVAGKLQLSAGSEEKVKNCRSCGAAIDGKLSRNFHCSLCISTNAYRNTSTSEQPSLNQLHNLRPKHLKYKPGSKEKVENCKRMERSSGSTRSSSAPPTSARICIQSDDDSACSKTMHQSRRRMKIKDCHSENRRVSSRPIRHTEKSSLYFNKSCLSCDRKRGTSNKNCRNKFAETPRSNSAMIQSEAQRIPRRQPQDMSPGIRVEQESLPPRKPRGRPRGYSPRINAEKESPKINNAIIESDNQRIRRRRQQDASTEIPREQQAPKMNNATIHSDTQRIRSRQQQDTSPEILSEQEAPGISKAIIHSETQMIHRRRQRDESPEILAEQESMAPKKPRGRPRGCSPRIDAEKESPGRSNTMLHSETQRIRRGRPRGRSLAIIQTEKKESPKRNDAVINSEVRRTHRGRSLGRSLGIQADRESPGRSNTMLHSETQRIRRGRPRGRSLAIIQTEKKAPRRNDSTLHSETPKRSRGRPRGLSVGVRAEKEAPVRNNAAIQLESQGNRKGRPRDRSLGHQIKREMSPPKRSFRSLRGKSLEIQSEQETSPTRSPIRSLGIQSEQETTPPRTSSSKPRGRSVCAQGRLKESAVPIESDAKVQKMQKCRNCNEVMDGTQSRQFHRFLCIAMKSSKGEESTAVSVCQDKEGKLKNCRYCGAAIVGKLSREYHRSLCISMNAYKGSSLSVISSHNQLDNLRPKLLKNKPVSHGKKRRISPRPLSAPPTSTRLSRRSYDAARVKHRSRSSIRSCKSEDRKVNRRHPEPSTLSSARRNWRSVSCDRKRGLSTPRNKLEETVLQRRQRGRPRLNILPPERDETVPQRRQRGRPRLTSPRPEHDATFANNATRRKTGGIMSQDSTTEKSPLRRSKRYLRQDETTDDEEAHSSNDSKLKKPLRKHKKGCKLVSYFCKPCNTTLLSWNCIRKHLLSSNHLMSASVDRQRQTRNSAKMKRLMSMSDPSTSQYIHQNSVFPELSASSLEVDHFSSNHPKDMWMYNLNLKRVSNLDPGSMSDGRDVDEDDLHLSINPAFSEVSTNETVNSPEGNVFLGFSSPEDIQWGYDRESNISERYSMLDGTSMPEGSVVTGEDLDRNSEALRLSCSSSEWQGKVTDVEASSLDENDSVTSAMNIPLYGSANLDEMDNGNSWNVPSCSTMCTELQGGEQLSGSVEEEDVSLSDESCVRKRPSRSVLGEPALKRRRIASSFYADVETTDENSADSVTESTNSVTFLSGTEGVTNNSEPNGRPLSISSDSSSEEVVSLQRMYKVSTFERPSTPLVRIDYNKEKNQGCKTLPKRTKNSVQSVAPASSYQSAFVDLGYRCDSLEFLEELFSSRIVQNGKSNRILGIRSLYNLLKHRECGVVRGLKKEDCASSVSSSVKDAPPPSKPPSMMIRFNYNKSFSDNASVCSAGDRENRLDLPEPHHCRDTQSVRTDGDEVNFSLEEMDRQTTLDPGKCRNGLKEARRIQRMKLNSMPNSAEELHRGERVMDIESFVDVFLSWLSKRGPCCCSCYSQINKDTLIQQFQSM